jgi:hypothetical protein
MIREIEKNRPEFLVYVSCGNSWLFQPRSDRTIVGWCEQYAERFYEPVGFVHKNSSGEVESFWDDAVKNHRNSGEEYVAVFKRRPDSEITPKKGS